ncbi:MAG: glycine cleavage system protein GcvH [bacterium]|nr:glycine cleavage system protein GcvH [bacterium]
MYPDDRRYSKEHEWVKLDADTGTIGITAFAQDQLGDIVYVELPEEGQTVKRDETMGTIESVKAVSEIYAPVSGTVVAVNQSLDETPETLNEDPHDKGWYCKIKLDEPAELEGLMEASAYQSLVDSE